MVNIRKLVQALEDHKYNVENHEVVYIPDSFDRLNREVEKVIEFLRDINQGVKED